MNSSEREYLNNALDYIINLEVGRALYCHRIEDKDQREELLRAKNAILKALDVKNTFMNYIKRRKIKNYGR